MAETKFINFRYGMYDEINGLGKDANCIYFASDKPLFYAVGKWHGIASMVSEVDRVNSKTILKINGDGGYAINCEIEGETLSNDLKEKLINAYEFVQLISGEDEDVIINKWNEIVAFLQGFGEADKLLNVVVELQNNLADEVANRISADQKHTEDIKSITDLVNDMFTLVDKGDGTKYIQSKYGFASDSFISARGVDEESGGVGGLDAQAVWDLLMQNDDATKIINVSHIPDITVAKITDFTAKVGDLIANKADKATTLSGYGITDAVTLNTDQTITGVKTFSNLRVNNSTMIANLNAEMVGGMHASDLTSSVIYPRKLDGILIKSKAKFSHNRHNIVTIKGANYAAWDKPYFTIVEFYSFVAEGGFYNVASSNIGHKIPEIKIFTIDDSVYIWFKHGMFQTFVVDWNCSDILGNNVESITNSAFPTEGVSRLVTTTPINVAYENSNVASATKLETPRTIWGQRFDGTNNVSGALYLGANSILGGDNLNILSHHASGYLDVGYGNATAGYSTYINGNSIHFRYSTEHNTGMLLSSTGNVGIGTVSPTAKLHVNGDSIINGNLKTTNIIPLNKDFYDIGKSDNGFNSIFARQYRYGRKYISINYKKEPKWYRIWKQPNGASDTELNTIISIFKNYYNTRTQTLTFLVSKGEYDKSFQITQLTGQTGLIKKIRCVSTSNSDFVDVYLENFQDSRDDFCLNGIGVGFAVDFEKVEEGETYLYSTELNIVDGFATSNVLHGAGLNINGTASITGDTTINGKLTVANQLTIGNATLYWDVANQCLRVNSGIASDSFLSAKGIDTTGNGQGGGGGLDATMLWNELTIPSPTNSGKVISSQFLPVQEILTPVASDISEINAEIIALQDRIANIEQALTWQGVS